MKKSIHGLMVFTPLYYANNTLIQLKHTHKWAAGWVYVRGGTAWRLVHIAIHRVVIIGRSSGHIIRLYIERE